MSFQNRAARVMFPVSLIWVLSLAHADGQEKPKPPVPAAKMTIPAKQTTPAIKAAPVTPPNNANKGAAPARGGAPQPGVAPGDPGGRAGGAGGRGRGEAPTNTGAAAPGGGISGAAGRGEPPTNSGGITGAAGRGRGEPPTNTGTATPDGGITGTAGRGRGEPPTNTGAPTPSGGITGGAGRGRGEPPANAGTSTSGGGITGAGGGRGGAGTGISGNGGRGGGRPAPPPRLPRPGEQAAKNPDGTHTYTDTRTGAKVHTGPDDHVVKVESPRGAAATKFLADGRPGHIEQKRADGSKLVVNQGGRGREVFVERPMQGKPGYISRTYTSGGRTEVRVYRTNTYHGAAYAVYVAPRHYRPEFYNWASHPWETRVVYSWGAPAPWFYGGYFAPQQFYDSPTLWLTDYLLAANLQLAFASQPQDVGPPPQDPAAPLSPEVKFLISLEVQRQIEAEQQASTAPPPPPPPPGQTAPEADPPVLNEKVFFVSASLDVVSTANGATCTLSGGDVIERTPGKPVSPDGKITVDVMSSKAGGCPADFTTELDIAQLQDMLNEFRAQLSEGMGKMADGQERGKGLPAGPAAGSTPSRDGAVPAPAPGDNQAQLDREARQTEAEIQQYIAAGQ